MLCGHSLGAGSASLLSVMLKEDFPELHCYAFSPPGGETCDGDLFVNVCSGLLSLNAARESQKWITSVVFGIDMVPRLTRNSLGKI